jgi:hypothetical protein
LATAICNRHMSTAYATIRTTVAGINSSYAHPPHESRGAHSNLCRAARYNPEQIAGAHVRRYFCFVQRVEADATPARDRRRLLVYFEVGATSVTTFRQPGARRSSNASGERSLTHTPRIGKSPRPTSLNPSRTPARDMPLPNEACSRMPTATATPQPTAFHGPTHVESMAPSANLEARG